MRRHGPVFVEALEKERGIKMKVKVPKILQLVLGGALCVAFTESAWVWEMAQAGDTTNKADVVTKYPPYPNVWDWVTPLPHRAMQYLQADIQSDGDVRISYELNSKELKKREANILEAETYGITFFGHQRVEPHEGIIHSV
ncbi:MAG: hypothetical protein P0119_11950 [Nitrospira sp.]|nr:hypothetical protein [Nitrospira sp.]